VTRFQQLRPPVGVDSIAEYSGKVFIRLCLMH
jgi:hypothetical protein